MESFINISPKLEKEAVKISVDSIIAIINACKDGRFSDEALIKALDVVSSSLSASADYITITNCNMQNEVAKEDKEEEDFKGDSDES